MWESFNYNNINLTSVVFGTVIHFLHMFGMVPTGGYLSCFLVVRKPPQHSKWGELIERDVGLL